MKLILILVVFVCSVFGADNIINEKNCERVQLSLKVDIISCSGRDYLVEYKSEDELRGEVVKVTSVTSKDVQVIKSKEK